MGIGSHAPSHETAQYVAHSPRFISTKTPSPTRLQTYPGINGSWSTYPLRSEDPYINMEERSPSLPMEGVRYSSRSPATHGKGGGRTGPLSQAQRQQASDVRRKGACLRCTVMREKVCYNRSEVLPGTNVSKCDSNYPCHNCLTKERRKCPKDCIPNRFDWDSCKTSLFPGKISEAKIYT